MGITFISAVLPVFVILYFIYRKDKNQPEPTGKLIKTFFAGCLSILPAALMESGLSLFAPDASQVPVMNGVYTGFAVAGFCEELCKLLLLLLVVWRSQYFDEYFDGIVYAVYLSMGFACVENVMYVFGNEDAMSVALARGVLAVPAHFLIAVTMGYYVSLAKFDPQHKLKHLSLALIYPVLLHGTYDSLLMVSENISTAYGEEDTVVTVVCMVLFVLFIVFDIMLWKWGVKRIKKMQQRSKEQDFNPLNPFENFTWNV